jgi:hypothetical protein
MRRIGASRRAFLGAAGAGVLLSVGGPRVLAATGARAGVQPRQFLLALDGQLAGPLDSVSGGFPVAQVGGRGAGRQITGIAYEPISLTFGAGMTKNVHGWINDAAAGGRASPRSGAIVIADIDGREQSRLDFFDAVVSRVAFPTLDTQLREPASIGITIAPAHTTRVAGSGAMVMSPAAKAQLKTWQSDAFRVSIDGLPPATLNQISRVEGLSVTLIGGATPLEAEGRARATTALGPSNLVITVAEAAAGPFYSWMDAVVTGTFDLRSARFELLDRMGTGVLASANVQGIRLISVAPEPYAMGEPARCKAEMIWESIDFSF